MSSNQRQQYFIMRLGENSERPVPEAAFEVQVLNEDGEGEYIAFIGADSNDVLAFKHSLKSELPATSHRIPLAVIAAARRCQLGFGNYVDASGEPVQLTFLTSLPRREPPIDTK